MSIEIDIVSRIAERFMAMSNAEKRVAQFILDDIKTATELPIAEFATRTGVSQATITRFARAMGCRDVRELKVKLAQSLGTGQRFIHEVPDLDGLQGVYESIISVLNTNRRAINEEQIKLAAQWITEARQTIAIGMGGGSTIAATELQHRLFRLGLPVTFQSDGLLVRMMAAAIDPKDIIVAMSLGGFTPNIVESAAIARQYNAKVIAITPLDTPLAENADLVLPLIISESDYIYKPSTSRYAMLAMIDVLATELAMSNRRQSRDRLRRIKLALDGYRGGDNRQPLGD